MTRCRVCGCTEVNACNPPCGWQPGAGNLCTSCAHAANVIAVWLDIANRANITGLIREARAIFAGEAVLQEPGGRPARRKGRK